MHFFGKWTVGTISLIVFSFPVWSQVIVRTNIMDIYYQGTNEETGAIALPISSDEFPSASLEAPVFIRIELQSGAMLTETRVAPELSRSSRSLQDPVYLAAALRDEPFDYRNNIGRNSIALVRWVAGETAVWLRITQPTSTWVRHLSGAFVTWPAPDRQVTFYVGVSATNSLNSMSPFFVDGFANLPCNTRDIASATPEDTRIEVDVSQATLIPSPDPACWLEVGFAGFDGTTIGVTTAPDEALIILGNSTNTVFQGDTVIARAFDLPELSFFYFVAHWYRFYQISILDLVLRVSDP